MPKGGQDFQLAGLDLGANTYTQAERHKAYDLTQRLTFFVIGIEFIFSGYLLLNASRFRYIDGIEWLFISSALA